MKSTNLKNSSPRNHKARHQVFSTPIYYLSPIWNPGCILTSDGCIPVFPDEDRLICNDLFGGHWDRGYK